MSEPTRSRKQSAVWWLFITAAIIVAVAVLMRSTRDTEDETVRIVQTKADSLFEIAFALEQQGDSVGAVANYRSALQHDPAHSKANYRLALINFANRNWERAGLFFDRALKSDPDNYLINYHLGLAFDRVGEPDSAARYLIRSMELKPDYDMACYSLGLLWLNRQEPDSALKYLRRYRGMIPDDASGVADVDQLIETLESEP